MTIMSKGWRYRGYILAITKNQYAPNRYSKVYLIKDNICKLFVCKSPWVTKYRQFYLTTNATSWTEETNKPQPFQDKQIQTAPLPPENSKWNEYRRDEEAGCRGGWERLMPAENDYENKVTKAIIHWLCWTFNSDSKLPFFGIRAKLVK